MWRCDESSRWPRPIWNAARQASSNYRTEQKRQQEAEKKKEKEDANIKAVNDEILAVQAKRRRIIEDSSLLKDSIEKLMDQAEKEQNLHHVTKANSFKRTIKEMELETVELDSTLIELQKKLKHWFNESSLKDLSHLDLFC